MWVSPNLPGLEFLLFKDLFLPGTVAHAFDLSTWETEGTLWASLAHYTVRACLQQQNPKISLLLCLCASWVWVPSEART